MRYIQGHPGDKRPTCSKDYCYGRYYFGTVEYSMKIHMRQYIGIVRIPAIRRIDDLPCSLQRVQIPWS